MQRTLLAAAFVLFAMRLLWLGDTVYILDEPLMQLRIDEAFANGEIPLYHSRGSSIPIPYGPGALWYFMLLRLVTWHPIAIVFCQLCFQLLGYALLARVVHKACGKEAFAWTMLLLASSPALFFLSRHTWDVMLLLPLSGAVLFLVRKLEEGGRVLPVHAGLGLLAGYSINTHLMFGPIFVALSATLLLWNLSRARSVVPLAVFGACALAVMLPYLVAAARIMAEEKPFEHARVGHRWGDGRNLWWTFLGTATYASLFNSRIMLNDLREIFFAYAGPPFAFLFRVDLFGWLGKLAAWGVAGAVLVRLARLRFDDSLVRIFLGLSFLFVVVVYQYLNIPLATHYYLPLWWFVFLGVGFALQALRAPWKQLLLASLTGTIFVNVSYDAFALAYLHANKGARNMEASVAVSEQLRNLREICGRARAKGMPEVKVFHSILLGDRTLDFLPRHMPECQGLKVTRVGDASLADLEIRYDPGSETSAALVAEPPTGKGKP